MAATVSALSFAGYMTISTLYGGPSVSLKTSKAAQPEAILPLALAAIEDQTRVDGAIITVASGNSSEVYALPINLPWRVRCGAGLSLQLGAVTGTSQTAPAAEVTLSERPLDRATCATVAPRVAKAFQEKLVKE
ncbi:hypothetical protein [Bradyrhizobium sp. ORS 285]|uniref:hypothetical protein n=1 Tax=Bradyrhizobium sp. ORS 285 TaxID=115808 RepID=UPI000555EB76|nr:hypothetical protein [Bradyrhizobium sp. ORS 285]